MRNAEIKELLMNDVVVDVDVDVDAHFTSCDVQSC